MVHETTEKSLPIWDRAYKWHGFHRGHKRSEKLLPPFEQNAKRVVLRTVEVGNHRNNHLFI